ncbi:MAG: hypothetical protein WBE26_06980, partial [Phycisphaerae bacterium]
MASNPRQLDWIEEALLELDAADKAQLFRRTRLDTHRLVTQPAPAAPGGIRRVALRLLPVAAAVAVAIGLWGWRSGVGPEGPASDAIVASHVTIQECFGGPT